MAILSQELSSRRVAIDAADVSGLGTAATRDDAFFAAASHDHTLAQITDAAAALALKAPVADPVFTGVTASPAFEDAVVTMSGTTPTVDLALGGEYRLTTTGNTTMSVANPPADGYTTTKTIKITQGGTAYTIAFWAGITTVNGAVPAAPAANETMEYTLRASTVSAATTYVLTETGVLV